MPGANNFQVFNEDYTNIMSDIDYTASTTRQEGVVSGPAVGVLHNKMYRQTSVMAAALAAAMAAKGYDMLDSSLANLILSLQKLRTDDEVNSAIAAASSDYIKTLLNNPDAASARATLGAAALLGLSTQVFSAANGAVGNQVVNISQFASSLVSVGYKKNPDINSPTGYFIEQWGRSTNIVQGSNQLVTFPVAFPTACLSVVASIYGQSANSATPFGPGIGTPSLTQVTLYNNGTNGSMVIQYKAIGY